MFQTIRLIYPQFQFIISIEDVATHSLHLSAVILHSHLNKNKHGIRKVGRSVTLMVAEGFAIFIRIHTHKTTIILEYLRTKVLINYKITKSSHNSPQKGYLGYPI